MFRVSRRVNLQAADCGRGDWVKKNKWMNFCLVFLFLINSCRDPDVVSVSRLSGIRVCVHMRACACALHACFIQIEIC